MPFVTIELVEGVFQPKEKQEMIKKVTDTMVEIEGESLRPYTWVKIVELKSGDVGMGGTPLTKEAVGEIASS